jgi:hypothetical protein
MWKLQWEVISLLNLSLLVMIWQFSPGAVSDVLGIDSRNTVGGHLFVGQL